MTLGVCEALRLRLLLRDFGCPHRRPIQLYCDNKEACDIAQEKLDEKIVELPKIQSEDQLADILTKAVSSRVFSKFLGKFGM